MRVTQISSPHIKTASFVDDGPEGCLIDACCESEIYARPGRHVNHYNIPHICKCGNEVFYPGWCEW